MAFFSQKGSSASRSENSKSRSRIRTNLKKAGQGNIVAFNQVCSNYSGFISNYLFLLGYTNSHDRIAEVERLLVNIWRYLPYTKRVSDFERFLFIQLGEEKPLDNRTFPTPHENLLELNHELRFLLVARVFEKWDYKALKLALRTNERKLSAALSNMKCTLVGFQSNLLQTQEKARIVQISELLEGNISSKNSRKIETEIATEYSSLQFKADWLSYRCELAELLESIRITEDDQGNINGKMPDLIRQQPMERPKLTENLSNLLSFDRVPITQPIDTASPN